MRFIKRDFSPDIIHIFGSEFPLGLTFIKFFQKQKIVLNIQTLACRLETEMDGGLNSFDFIKNLSLRECFALKSHFMRRIYAGYRSRNERRYFEKVNYVIGSTLWDKAYIRNNYPWIKYYSCQYLFRKAFYEGNKWSACLAQPNSILVGQAAAPHKGLHILLKALFYVKKEIENIKLYIPGPDLLSRQFMNNYSYARYIHSIIHKYHLSENVVFTGPLGEREMMERMLLSQMVVVPSAIELGSSMLCEAMLLGVPVIAAFRGGMTEKFQHGISGFYYDFPEFYILAEYIKRLLRDQELAKRISSNELVIAHHEHGEEKCIRDFCQTYHKIAADNTIDQVTPAVKPTHL
jgi:glycosyltransferase involved in cell wall biosynthesis